MSSFSRYSYWAAILSLLLLLIVLEAPRINEDKLWKGVTKLPLLIVFCKLP